MTGAEGKGEDSGDGGLQTGMEMEKGEVFPVQVGF